jgi:hypothetical protein
MRRQRGENVLKCGENALKRVKMWLIETWELIQHFYENKKQKIPILSTILAIFFDDFLRLLCFAKIQRNSMWIAVFMKKSTLQNPKILFIFR